MTDSQNRSESPDIIYGRLLEAAHLFGYSGERATDSFEWLIEDNRWQQVGGGFDDINKFLASVAAQSSQFTYSIEQRKRVAKKLAELQASQRKTAEALGVDNATIHRDLKPADQDKQDSEIADATPDHLKTDPADVHRKAQRKSHTEHNTGENEWYTPPHIIDAATQALGSIDLDPASSHEANKTVQAEAIFTREDDGLRQEWYGNVWLNPPYASDLVQKFTDKLIAEYVADRLEAACLLVNNGTETKWFQKAIRVASAVAFPEGRISYWNPDRTSKTPLQGQAILYFGADVERFTDAFSSTGVVLHT